MVDSCRGEWEYEDNSGVLWINMISIYVVLIWESWTRDAVKERIQVMLKMFISQDLPFLHLCSTRKKVTTTVEKCHLYACT